MQPTGPDSLEIIMQTTINYLNSMSDIFFITIIFAMMTYFVSVFFGIAKRVIEDDDTVIVPPKKPSPLYLIKLYVMRWIDHLFIKYYVLKSTRRNSKGK